MPMPSTARSRRSKRLWPPLLDRGRRLGVDVGTVRIGVAICDPDGLIATPLVTLPADSAIASLVELIKEYDAVEVIVGLPRHLKGFEGQSAEMARSFAERLKSSISIPVELVDERLTSKSASAALSASGRKTKEQRGLIDQVAAASLLQLYLDSHRR